MPCAACVQAPAWPLPLPAVRLGPPCPYCRRWCCAAIAAVLQVYCLDSQFAAEMPKFIAGCMSALSAMVQLELPHVNVFTKMDLCKNKVRGV